jgi:hypothetical protein
LVIVEKGVKEDIEASRQRFAERGVADRVQWVKEMTHVQLRSFYALKNVVLCDQFNPHVASLGNIGRESAFFGLPLITSANADITMLYADDPPPHIVSADTTRGVLAAMERVSTSFLPRRQELAAAANAWGQRNLSPSALMPRYVKLLESVVAGHRARRALDAPR